MRRNDKVWRVFPRKVCHPEERGNTSRGAHKKKEQAKGMIEHIEGYHTYYVYIITNKYRSVLYTGVTNNLKVRLNQHKKNVQNGNRTFASRYNVEFLIYYEKFTWIQLAIAREKEIKGWRRDKKLALIRSFNPSFEFLDHHFSL